MQFVSLNRLGLVAALAARLARKFLASENGADRIVTESGDAIILE